MWLVPRDTRGLTSRSPVPDVVREALVRWYTGEGEDSDHRASVIMVVKARDHHQWIACDCLGEGTDPPLLSPAYLSEAETYYLRRLTSIRQRRPEHDVDCPFFREQAPPRIREKATATPRTINEPDGLFSAHRLAPEKLAQLPDDSEPDDRTRGVAIPRLARLLWQLMEMAQVNVVEPLEVGEPRTTSMASEFAAMRAAAERVQIAPGIPLARHLYTHIDPYERGIVFAKLREAAKKWPTEHAPQAFLLLYAIDVSGSTITLAEGRELIVKNRIRHIGVHQRHIGPPYLVLAVVGEHNPREGYACLRAYTCYQSSRLSCRFCVLQSLGDAQASASAPANRPALLHLVGLEATSTFSFQPARWLADVAPRHIPGNLRNRISLAKADAAERRRLEAAMPPDLRYVKGWPPRIPTIEEAGIIAASRAPILSRHGLADLYPNAGAVRDRFSDLIALKRAA